MRLALLFALLLACGRSPAVPRGGNPPVELTSGWQYRAGEAQWTPWSLGQRLGPLPAIDLRIRLPEGRWRLPALFLRGVDTRFTAALDGEPLATPPQRDWPGPLPPWMLLLLPGEPGGKLLELHVTSTNPLDIGPYGRVAVGSMPDLVLSILAFDGPAVLVALFSLSIALVALSLFARRREDLSYPAFALWASARAAVLLCVSDTRLLLWDAPAFWEHLLPLARIAAPLALWATADQLFGSPRPLRRALAAAAVTGALIAAALLIDLQHTYLHIFRLINLLLLASGLAMLFIAVRAARTDREAQVFVAGFAALFVATVHDLLIARHLIDGGEWSIAGELIVVAAVAAIVLGRLAAVYRALSAHARELQEINARLSATEELLTHAVRARDDFLTVAAHELRTPLTSMRLQLELLKRAGASPDVLSRQVDRLERLIAGLLDVSRVQAQQLALEYEEVDLAALARETAQRLSPQIAVDAPPELKGRWDRLRLEQVLENLLSNALKYGLEKPVALKVEKAAEGAVITVLDHGIGIASADQARIFDRFERAVSEHHYGGLGLGLWITREIVRAFGGTISVESSPGKGAAFRVELPYGAGGGSEGGAAVSGTASISRR